MDNKRESRFYLTKNKQELLKVSDHLINLHIFNVCHVVIEVEIRLWLRLVYSILSPLFSQNFGSPVDFHHFVKKLKS